MKIFLTTLITICALNVSFAQRMLIHKTDGTIDEYETSEIDSITFTDIFDGLLGFYPFKTNADDFSGNGNDGSEIGDPIINNFLALGNNATEGISLPDTMVNGMTDFTFSAMLKINTLHNSGSSAPGNSWISLTGYSNWGGNALNFFYMPGSDVWRVVMYPPGVAPNSPGTGFNYTCGTVMEDNNWHHVAFTRDNDELKCYIDGQQVGNVGIFNTAPITVAPMGFIVGQEQDYVGGGFETNQSWAGNIDNLRVFDRALTEQEIETLFSIDGY